eukprot:CAMPEP_0181531500 /NCGR_PEP_ID=MMETSP1110-20121109/72135_1 /TAXON_ID=174948 /ORGANISM="Symbiodinium sp., Strain CCMP421" /LENGTH=237 /DNA_ID=CAMNT_0023662577 /DNA_START=28 /DNA_END=740 /DNA_ORIENTATION=-
MPVKQELTQACQGHWKTEMFQAPCQAPLSFCYGCCCIPCAAYQQRSELLDLTGEPYICCVAVGSVAADFLSEPQDRTCLCAEVCCCPGLAVSGNRFMVQTRFDKENTACDDCIITGTCLFVWIVDIARCFIDIPREIDLLADCVVLSVTGCMHAQQQIEIDDIKKNGYQGMPPLIMNSLPPAQQMMFQKVGISGASGGMHPAMVGAPQPQYMDQYPQYPQQGMPVQGVPVVQATVVR